MKTTRLNWKHRWNQFKGIPIEFDLSSYHKILDKADRLHLDQRTDEELKRRAMQLREQARNGVDLDPFLAEAFALAREAADRSIGLRPYNVQMIAGMVLHHGKLAEMQTGEGKTLAAVLPAYFNALSGKGVHILTFNDYLARRDAAWMGPVFRFLGLKVGCIQEGQSLKQRQSAYSCDITYATAKEAGFDFLRDQLRRNIRDVVHRPFHYALVDEADSLLIDEARVPLVIAGKAEEDEESSHHFHEIVDGMTEGREFEIDEGKRNIFLTESGTDQLEKFLNSGRLHSQENLDLLTRINLALHARYLLKRDVDYIVRNGRIEIVDEFTGRVVEDRHWPDGLQAALEEKEGLRRRSKGKILGSITLQHFFGLYPKLCGMTATAQPAADEIKTFYGLDVTAIPPNRPCIRRDEEDSVFLTKAAKNRALVKEIGEWHSRMRPVLVGTSSVEESEQLTKALREKGIGSQVLNAKNDELEAGIIAKAGMPGAVTISTNMAGRGTDIKLGGEDEKKRARVVSMGGLIVIGTNRHESLRVDQQLRGRAGRQGDPGTSRFYISLEDDLLVEYGISKLIPEHNFPDDPDSPIQKPRAAREVARGQRIVEGENFNIRKTLWKYSALLENQRKVVQIHRRAILEGREKMNDFETNDPGRFNQMISIVGREQVQELERLITLLSIDQCWMDHLGLVSDIKEGIHLSQIAGDSPREEFLRRVYAAFLEMEKQIARKKQEIYLSLEMTSRGLDPEQAGLKGPSSTWTYLINDEQFGFWTKMLMGKNVAIAAAGISAYLPFYFLLGIIVWIRKKLGKKRNEKTK